MTRKRAETDDTVSDAPAKAQIFAQRYLHFIAGFIICICTSKINH